MNYFAVFVVAPVNGGFAATTRASDRGEAGKIGFPGGKVDPGEPPTVAASREAMEEGWLVRGIETTPFHTAVVEGRLVAWYRANSAIMLKTYKEQGRIMPIVATKADMARSGYGNDKAMAAY